MAHLACTRPAVDIASLVQSYGYAAVFVGSLLEGETVVALGGLAAHRGYIALPWVMAIAAGGSFIGDQIAFWIGRYYGARLLGRFPQLATPVARATAAVERHAWMVVPLMRFMYGLRLAGAIAVGITRIGTLRFTLLNLAGASVWAVLVAAIGYAFGEALTWLLGDLRRIEEWAFGGLIALGVAAWLIVRQRHPPSK